MALSAEDRRIVSLTIAGEIAPSMSPYGEPETLAEVANILATIENRYRTNKPGMFGSKKLRNEEGEIVGTLTEYDNLSHVCLQNFQYSTWNDSGAIATAKDNFELFGEFIEDYVDTYFAGGVIPSAENATHYHAYYVNPSWAASLRKVIRVGPHIFYEVPDIEFVRDPIRAEPSPGTSAIVTSPQAILMTFRSDPRQFAPKSVVTPNHPIWALVHEDLAANKLGVLGHTGSGFPRDKISAGALQAADAVFRLAATEGVEMTVAIGGGSNGHSANHGDHPSGVGEAIDIKPTQGWSHGSSFAQVYRYAELAAAARADRLGIPHNSSGLHVQRVAVTARPVMSWNYGAPTNLVFRTRLQNGEFKSSAYSTKVAAVYSGITILSVQKSLNALGFNVDEDDAMGPDTAGALESYYSGG